MQRVIAGIVLIAVFIAGYFYVRTHGSANPVELYKQVSAIPQVADAKSFVGSKIATWKPDPEDPSISVPQNWTGENITVGSYTFKVYSPSSEIPPSYYISFQYPKPLIAQTNLIKCFGTAATDTTDVCVVGHNTAIDAYFSLMKFFNSVNLNSLAPHINVNN